MTLGESLRRFRKNFHLSQKQVASAGKVSWQSYQSYESGKSFPSVQIIINIADAYDVSTDYLVGRSDSPQPMQFDEREVNEAFAFRDAWQKAMQILPKVSEEKPNATTLKAIEEAERGEGLSRTFNSVDELLEDLNNDA